MLVVVGLRDLIAGTLRRESQDTARGSAEDVVESGTQETAWSGSHESARTNGRQGIVEVESQADGLAVENNVVDGDRRRFRDQIATDCIIALDVNLVGVVDNDVPSHNVQIVLGANDTHNINSLRQKQVQGNFASGVTNDTPCRTLQLPEVLLGVVFPHAVQHPGTILLDHANEDGLMIGCS